MKSKALGLCTLISLLALAVMGLWVTPPDAIQSDAVRLLYLHAPAAWGAYLAFAATSIASALYLWPRTRSMRWDAIAGASAEVGVIFTGLTLLVGSLWGKPIWGDWWSWDARVTTTAVLFFLYLGYLALRGVDEDPAVHAKRNAVVALIAFVDVPVVHFSVTWWRTQHQSATVFNPDLKARIQDGSMRFTLALGVLAFTLLYVYLVSLRVKVSQAGAVAADADLDRAIIRRREEGA
ncbi:MAG: cytochrome c biogenesis protein CcsA [Acidimicrobiia bacterium]